MIKNLWKVVFLMCTLLPSCTPIPDQVSYPTPKRETPYIYQYTSTPTVYVSPVENSDPTTADKETFLKDVYYYLIDDERYNTTTHVLHKYISDIEISIVGSKLHVILHKEPKTIDDFLELAFETLVFAAYISNEKDWGVDYIDLIYPNLEEWEIKFSIDNYENIMQVVDNNDALIDVMNFSLSPKISAQMTASARSTVNSYSIVKLTPTPKKTTVVSQYEECRFYSSGYATCKIQHAYCSYQPSTNGSPTFCNDAPYPGNSFTYLVWDHDVSYLNGRCIIVRGDVEDYNGIPQITWNDNSGFVGYCD